MAGERADFKKHGLCKRPRYSCADESIAEQISTAQQRGGGTGKTDIHSDFFFSPLLLYMVCFSRN
jgi:hypothetical protein